MIEGLLKFPLLFQLSSQLERLLRPVAGGEEDRRNHRAGSDVVNQDAVFQFRSMT